MTKKDYIIVSSVLRNHYQHISNNLLMDLVEAFEKDNPRFDSYKFIGAIMDGHVRVGAPVNYTGKVIWDTNKQ